MSVEALEFAIIIIGSLIIIGAVAETARILTRHSEIRRERFLEETRSERWRRNTPGEAD